MELIRAQNETITLLRERLEASTAHSAALVAHRMGSNSELALRDSQAAVQLQLEQTFAELEVKEEEIVRLKQQVSASSLPPQSPHLTDAFAQAAAAAEEAVALEVSSSNPLNGTSKAALLPSWLIRSKADEECEARFGYGLSDRWRRRKEAWCAMPSSSSSPLLAPPTTSSSSSSSSAKSKEEVESSIHCYPYQQEHKKEGRRKSTDMFCEGRNVFVDFSKVKGSHGAAKPPLGAQYLDFGPGATFATCQQV
jgi:hypothetical protein